MLVDDVEKSKSGKSYLVGGRGGAAMKDVSVNLTTCIDTLIDAMLIFHHKGWKPCINMFPSCDCFHVQNW